MARISKIDNAFKKRFTRQEKKRAVEIKEQRVYFLIICEGEKTEPNYFKSLKKDLPVGSLTVTDITVEGTGKNTESLVHFALKYRKNAIQKFDRVWAVFDRDSFTENQFNSAIITAETNNINCAWSNEAFELWFLLHFQYIDTAMSRKDYQSYFEREVKRVSKKEYKYKKNDSNTYETLKQHGSQTKASYRAKQLHKIYTNTRHAEHNPCTLIYLLIEELFNPGNILEASLQT